MKPKRPAPEGERPRVPETPPEPEAPRAPRVRRTRRPHEEAAIIAGAIAAAEGVDVTEAVARSEEARAEVTAQLRQSEARYQALVEQSPVSIVGYDARGRVLSVNPAFMRLWGVGVHEVPPGYSILTDPQLEALGVMGYIRRAFSGEAVQLPPVRYDIAKTSATGEGEARWVEARLYPVRDASGAITEVVLMQEDVTARVEAERARDASHAAERLARIAAEEASRAKGDFLSKMSHELRTPLNAIGGYAELLELGVHGPVSDAQREALARIQRSQRQLLALVNDVFNFTRLQSGNAQFHCETVLVADVLTAVERQFASQIVHKQLDFAVAVCTPGLTVWADPDKLTQLLHNLLSNAVRFTPEGGRLRVGCEDAAPGEDGRPRLAIRIEDSGIGIPRERLGAIFEPFVQVRRGLSDPSEGAGLGLAISRDLARGMDGDISVESTLGQGSTFTLTLPTRAPSGSHSGR